MLPCEGGTIGLAWCGLSYGGKIVLLPDQSKAEEFSFYSFIFQSIRASGVRPRTLDLGKLCLRGTNRVQHASSSL
jgi:hypothetical protein